MSSPPARLVASVRRVRQATPRARILSLDLGGQPFSFHAGQAVLVGSRANSERWPYSIASSPGQATHEATLDLLVLTDEASGAALPLAQASAGSTLAIEGPLGAFGVPRPLREPHVLLLAGGTGIAPLRAILWDTLETLPETTITVIYSARTPEEFAYLDELQELSAAGRIGLTTTATRSVTPDWTGGAGRVSAALLATRVRADSTCLVCGPAGFVESMRQILFALKVPAERITKERYGV